MTSKIMKRLLACHILLISLVLNAQAQRRPSINSPEVHSDNTVTFRFDARNAKEVALSGEFLPANQPMKKDTSGVWSITIGPVKPDIYPYSFVADGISVADPNNTQIFANERFKRLSLIHI